MRNKEHEYTLEISEVQKEIKNVIISINYIDDHKKKLDAELEALMLRKSELLCGLQILRERKYEQ